jgi:cytochrome b pre-mRNA-processing protein 3
MGLSRKMKTFADAFFGRVAAYESTTDVDGLAAALARNLYRGADVDGRCRALAAYALAARVPLAASVPQGLDFGPLPAISMS